MSALIRFALPVSSGELRLLVRQAYAGATSGSWSYGGRTVNKKQEMDIAWRRCLKVNAEVQEAEKECRQRGRHTMQCAGLTRDARKLKAEYEKVCRAPESNPLKLSHGAKFQSEKIVGDLMGRNGPDKHHRIDGNQDRRGK